MEQVVMGLALEYAKARGLNTITDKALEYAYETLGIEPEEDDYINEGGIYGIKNAFSPKNLVQSLGRNVLSGAAKKAISGSGLSSLLGPLGLLGGALMLGNAFNPTRPGSRNYNPNLQGQIDYVKSLDGYYGINPGSGLAQYGPNSVLSGQNVMSMFGTNDYAGQLDKTIGYFEDRIAAGKTYSQKNYEKALQEQDNLDWNQVDKDIEQEEKEKNRKDYASPYAGKVHGDGDAGGGGGYNDGDGGSYSGQGEDSNWGGGE